MPLCRSPLCPGGTHAELVLGLVPDAGSPPAGRVSDGGALQPPLLTAADWMRRGALAERLGHVGDARAAYRASVKLGFSLSSYMALLRLEAAAGSASDTLLCAGQVLSWHQQRLGGGKAGSGGSTSAAAAAGASSSSSSVVVMGVPPEAVVWALGLLADAIGVDAARVAAAGGPPALLAVLDEWQRWQGWGC